MMENEIDRELLEKIADMLGKPVGAFNIRKDTGCDGRQSTDHIHIDSRTDGRSGIDIHVLDGTVGETCHIPAIITKPGIQETVYNDFYIGDDCDITIVAGCGFTTAGSRPPSTTASTPSTWASAPASATRKSITAAATARAAAS